jgi:uncharacterized repeat protein (TIGR01451 family)
LGPENETATGPNFVHKYSITLDVATGQSIGKPLTIQDCTPDGTAYQGNPTFQLPTGWPAPTITAPPIGTVGGCVNFSWNNIAMVGGLGPDAIVQFDFSVADQYANGNQVLDNTCKPVVLDNPVSISGKWQPLDPRDSNATVTGNNGSAHQLAAKCLAIQKSVKVSQDTNFPGPTPGDLLQYTLNFQVSDYKTIGEIKIVDQLADGQVFQAGPAPVLTIGDQFGNHTIPVLPAHYTATLDPTTTFKDCPVKGSTKLSFDVSGALAAIPPTNPRQAAGILTGGYATSPTSPIPATGTLVFFARIGDTFNNVLLPAKYVDKDDPICNAVEIQGTVHQNDPKPNAVPPPVSPTQIAEDTSASKIAIVTDALKKSVYAVKRGAGWVCGSFFAFPTPPLPCQAGQQVFPGDQVTFRIQYVIPSGDAQNLVIRDWLPLPIFNLTGMPSLITCPSTAATVPVPNTIRCGPSHTAQLPLVFVSPPPPSGSNSIQFTYGTMHDVNNLPKTIDLLFTSIVTNQPFADGLFLTNEVQECEQNTFNTTFCQTAVTQVQVREPKLNVRKGVIATDNPNGLFTQPTSPASTVAQAPNLANFQLTGWTGKVTSTMLGNTPGPSPIGALFDSNLSNVDANDVATFAVVIENQGGYPAFNVHLDDFIPSSAGLPTCFTFVPNTISMRNGAGAVLTPPIVPTLNSFGVTLSSIPALDASTLTTGTNIVIITFQVKLIAQIQAGCCENKADLTRYTSSATLTASNFNFVTAGFGGPFTDTARVCVGPSASAKCIVATSEAHTTPQQAAQGGQVPAAIGEIVRFRLITIIPEGTTQNFQIEDMLPVGLTYIGKASAVFVANNPVTNSSNIPTISAPSVQCPGPPLPLMTAINASPNSFPTGTGMNPNFPVAPITVTNNDINDANLEYLIIEYNAQVDNIPSNQNSTVLPNSFAVKFKDAFTGQTVVSTSQQVSVAIIEPKLTLTKTANPTSIIQGLASTVTYTVTIANAPGTTTAFDLAFTDALPAGFVAGSVSVSAPGCTTSPPGPNLSVTCSSPLYSGLASGSSLIITYKATVTPQTCPATMTNNAAVVWTSLPGPNGTVSNPTGSTTVGGSGADNGERNGLTPPLALNDYRASGSAPIHCVVPTRDVLAGKLYASPPGSNYPDNLTFKFTGDCSDPANPAATHVPLAGTITSHHPPPNQVFVGSGPVGWSCNITEQVPPGTDANGCHWAPGLAVTANPFTVQGSGLNAVVFQNNYICSGNPSFDLGVINVNLTPGGGGTSETFAVTVQNLGEKLLTGADLSHLTVTDNLPGGSIVTGYASTSKSDWSCPQTPTAAPVTCTYIGSVSALVPFAGLPQLQFTATIGTGATQYIDPATGATTNVTTKSNCAVISLKGTGTPDHDDEVPGNNVQCVPI